MSQGDTFSNRYFRMREERAWAKEESEREARGEPPRECFDFLFGHCARGHWCRFKHSESSEEAREAFPRSPVLGLYAGACRPWPLVGANASPPVSYDAPCPILGRVELDGARDVPGAPDWAADYPACTADAPSDDDDWDDEITPDYYRMHPEGDPLDLSLPADPAPDY